jgi:hypothetical protein
MDSLGVSLRDLHDTATYSTFRLCTITPSKWNLTPVRQFSRCSRHYLRDDGSVSFYSEQRPLWKVHLLMASMLVDIHFNDPEQSTLLLLPFTDALLDHLSLFVSQMRVVARSVTNPAKFVCRHGSIMHPWRQFDFLCPRVGPPLNVAYRRESGR